MVISSVEFHEDFIPKPLDWKAACPPFAIIFGWAYARGFLEDWVLNETLYEKLYTKLEHGQISIDAFVMQALDGCLTKDIFIPKVGRFIEDYLMSSILDVDLVEFFEVKHIYDLPRDWESCKTFFPKLDERFAEEQGAEIGEAE